MPKDLTFHQQLMLEFVKSQYGAAVLGLLTFPVLGIGISAFIAPLIAELLALLSAEGKEAVLNLNPPQQLGLLLFPAIGPAMIGAKLGAEAAQKVKELNLGNRLLSLGGIFT